MKRLTYIALLLITINCEREIYKCEDDGFKDEQCMKREVLGTNTFYWLKKCKGAQVCVDLPYYGEMIGSCSIKVRSHYDGESCANNNKCTSGVCDGSKCVGKPKDERCEVGLGQCKKGLLCRLKDTNAAYTSCQDPIDNDKECNGLYPPIYYNDDDPLNPIIIYPNDPINPAYNPCKLGYVCSNNKCVKIGSVTSTAETVSNKLACASGYLDGSNCDDLSSGSFYGSPTSKGATVKLDKNYTDMFKDWLNEADKNDMKDEDAIYEAYRYTRNKKKVNKAWFIYTHYSFVRDADECAFDYKWKQSSSNYIQFSLIILIFTLLF